LHQQEPGSSPFEGQADGRALSSHVQAIHQSEKHEHLKFIAMRAAMHKSRYRPDQPLIGLRCENVNRLAQQT
jgi:hypothetical protein